MALVKETLKIMINDALNKALLRDKSDLPADVQEQVSSTYDLLAQELADAIDAYIRSGDVLTTVATTGTASAQAGTGAGKIS